jgi:hypothetical protein
MVASGVSKEGSEDGFMGVRPHPKKNKMPRTRTIVAVCPAKSTRLS